MRTLEKHFNEIINMNILTKSIAVMQKFNSATDES